MFKKNYFIEKRESLSNPNLLTQNKKSKAERTAKKKERKQSCHDEFAPPHLIFEQGEILKCFPNIDIK